MAEETEEPTGPVVDPAPVVEPTPEPTPPAPVTPTPTPTPTPKPPVKPRKDTNQELRAAVDMALNHYRKTHTMKSPDDFKYPGFKEMYRALNS